MPYAEALALQRRLLRLRCEGRIDDILLTVEHPPTVTLGRFGKMDNVLLTQDELERRGVSLVRSDRGGDATFHCPGQLVVYPIMDLRARGIRLRDFTLKLEGVAIGTLASYGISAARWPEHPGIWVDGAGSGRAQVGAIGLRVSRGVAMHGLSLNVFPELKRFEVINLCGLPGMKAASIASLTGRRLRLRDVRLRLQRQFSGIFRVKLDEIAASQVMADSLSATEA